MDLSRRRRMLGFAVGIVACGADPPRSAAPLPAQAPTRRDEASVDPDENAAPLPPAQASVVPPPATPPPSTVAEGSCPRVLEGRHVGDLTLAKACGSMLVRPGFAVDGGTLTIEAGVSLRFEADASLDVGYREAAKLVVLGTSSTPVRFSPAASGSDAHWRGVRLYDHADDSVLRNVVIERAGDDRGALRIEAQRVALEHVSVRDPGPVALAATPMAAFAQFSSNSVSSDHDTVVVVPPALVQQIDPSNTFDAHTRIRVPGGPLATSSRWVPTAAVIEVTGPIRVAARDASPAELTFDPGLVVEFGPTGALEIGRDGPGALEARGTAERPVILRAHNRPEPGAWRGLSIHEQGRAVLSHVNLAHAGERERDGALLVEDGASVSVEDCTFELDRVGLVMRGKRSRASSLSRNTFVSTPVAFEIPAREVGRLGTENQYGGARVIVRGGSVREDQVWPPQEGATVELRADLDIDSAELVLAPGFVMHVRDGAKINVGYADHAALIMRGTKTQPVQLLGLRDSTASWGPIMFHEHARSVVVDHAVLRNAGQDGAALVFRAGAQAQLGALECERCGGSSYRVDDGATVGKVGRTAG